MLLSIRRRWYRLAAVAVTAALGGGVGCREAPVDPGRAGVARFGIAPVFPAVSRAAGLMLDEVRLVVIRPPAETIFVQRYPFPASSRTLSISADVPLEAQSEQLRLDLEAWGGPTLLFRGTTTARVETGTSSGDPVTMPMSYVGPGAQVARLQIAPRDTVVSFGAALPLRVSAFDAQGAVVPDFYISWGSSDPAALPDPAGVFSAGTARGSYRITAATPNGVSDSTNVTVTAPAASLQKTGGDGQSALAGARLALPLEVEVRGSDNLPVAGVEVTFAAPAGASVDNSTVTTNAAGRASTGATLALAGGAQSFTATAGGAGSVTFGATGTFPVLDFTAPAQVAAESNGNVSVALRLSSPAPLPVSVTLGLGGTATSPADYSAPASVQIPAGATGATINVSLVADGLAEPDETIILTLGTPTNATLGSTTVHTITITGQTPSVSFAAASQRVSETVGNATVTVQLSGPSTQAVTVPFTLGGTAVSPADYTISASPLTIPAGSTTGSITVTVVADAVAEADETVIVTLGTPTNATLGATTVHTLTIAGQVPSVSFATAGQTVIEAVGAVTVTVQLSNSSTSPVTVPFTVAGTATSGADFTVSATPLTIPAGSTSGAITVTVVADGVAEPDETVIITMGTPTNATLGATTVHTVTILGQQPSVSFAAAGQTVSEAVGTASVTVQLSSPSTQAITIPFTLSGTAASPADYTTSPTPLTIPAGSTTGTITVTVVADGVAEPDETVIITLGTPTNATLGATTVHTVTILGQTPSVSFAAANQRVSETVGNATVTVQLSGPSTQAVTVPFTLSGTAASPADYTISASPLIIPAGSTSGTITVTVVADAVAEADETVIITLGTPTNATLGATIVHTLTIAGQVPSVSFATAGQSVSETAGAVTVTVQLSIASTSAVTLPFTVSGTATSGADFTVSASPLNIPAGSTSGTITVTVISDGVAEPNETVILTMGTPVNATLGAITSHTVTILGQQPTVSFAAAAQSAGEAAGTVLVAVQLSSPSTSAVTVPFTAAGTATLGSDYSLSASPVVIAAGAVSANISVNLVNDSLVESSETVILTLGTPTNATLGTPSQHTLTIVDNDFLLTVGLTGRGSGTVATAAGIFPVINCTTGGPASGCSATYQSGTQVSLIATPTPTSEGIYQFEGWTGTGTGFTCTTTTTCTFVMNQSRQVTARFSTPGSITFVPSTAGFTMVERGALPAEQSISVTNTGERPLTLDATIPVSYAPQVSPWLLPKINTLVVDTLTPATMTLNLLTAAATLPAGTYQATVFLRDAGLQFSWTITVTLTVTPPPSPPVISNIVVTLLQLNDAARCTLGTPAASSFRITFDYTDPNGNGPLSISQAALNITWLFHPQNDTGGFTNYTFQSSLTGNGATGSANTVQCYRFGTNTSVDVTMSIVDQGGLRSAGATVNFLKPAGSN